MRRAIDEFHIFYENSRLWEKTKWLGVPMWKLPFDAFIIQELIWKIKPDYIIETGTGKGGSAVFYATICEAMNHGVVLTCDLENKTNMQDAPQKILNRIRMYHGGSTNPLIFEKMCKKAEDMRNIVILDSDHNFDHVRLEMSMYSTLVSVGSYMIVEDTHVNGHPVPWKWEDGPYEAVEDFLKFHGDEWEADFWCEKYMMTFNPKGYLRRVK